MPGGIVGALLQSAQRQEALIEALVAAVEEGDDSAILETARNLVANRRQGTVVPNMRRGRKQNCAAEET